MGWLRDWLRRNSAGAAANYWEEITEDDIYGCPNCGEIHIRGIDDKCRADMVTYLMGTMTLAGKSIDNETAQDCIDTARLQQISAFVSDGGRLTHENGVELLGMIERERSTASVLAANQCHHGYGDDYGNHRCKYQDRIAELSATPTIDADMDWNKACEAFYAAQEVSSHEDCMGNEYTRIDNLENCLKAAFATIFMKQEGR